MVEWLKNNVYIAFWLSPAIALVGIVVHNSRVGTEKVDWSKAMLYIGFVTTLAVIVTPSADPLLKIGLAGIGGVCLGFIVSDAFYRR